MSETGSEKILRIGLLSSSHDPVAQLLEDLYAGQSVDFVQVSDPADEAMQVDEIFVLSQSHALAHIEDLIATKKRCRILLRRHCAPSSISNWRAGIEWLAATLKIADWPTLELVALTSPASAELAEFFERPIKPLDGLPQIPGKRPVVAIARDHETISFSGEAVDGNPEMRQAQLEIFNWSRLRRLAWLKPANPDDPDMADLTAFANGALPKAATPAVLPTRAPCIFAVVPNGVGLGHITRMMAIAKALQEEGGARVIFWSFSRAAEILQSAGFEVFLRQNVLHLGAHPPDWRQWETLEFASAIRHFRPAAITYDGGNFDMFMIDALRSPGCGWCGVVWVRRGMLHPDSDALLLEAEQYCDIVLEPGDLAVEMDMGPTRMRRAQYRGFSRRITTGPVTLKSYLHSYDRRTARKRLGLGRGRYCLVSLGGAFGNWDTLRGQIVELAKRNRVKLIWAQSPLAEASHDELGDANTRKIYPLSPYLQAFDGMITAAGYNSYHELMLSYEGPVLLAPTNYGRLDDQVARATFAAKKNWASVVYADRPEDQSGVIKAFMEQVRKGDTAEIRPDAVQGAPEMAREILSVCKTYM